MVVTEGCEVVPWEARRLIRLFVKRAIGSGIWSLGERPAELADVCRPGIANDKATKAENTPGCS